MRTYLSLLLLFSSSCTIIAQKLRPECQQECAEGGGGVVICEGDKFVFASCGDETCNPDTNTCGVCGDGNVSPGETCDDGNQKDGDGCSAVCQEEDASNCGNGVVENGEACDDGNNQNGDECETNCTLPSCGNGILDSGEVCEDGNAIDGDGCRGDCRGVEDCGDGLIDLGEECDDGNTTENDGCSSVCQLVAAIGCGNGQLEANLGEVCDDGNNANNDGCRADCLGEEICGDGLIDAQEDCDDTNALNSNTRPNACRLNCQDPRCGDGVVDDAEQCDDGNTINNDACASNCLLITVAEQEDNEFAADADDRANADARLDVSTTTRISGSVTAGGDFDTFRISLAAPATVRMETFDSSGQDCQSIDTRMFLVDQNDETLLFDDTRGIRFCAALVTRLPAGFSYVVVSDFSGGGIGSYTLEINVLADVGVEAEPNNILSQATPLSGKNIVVLGNHPSVGDSDFYKIQLEQTASLRIEAVEGGNESCESFGIDPRITLFDSSGGFLADDDDGGRVSSITGNPTFCALVDGTGAQPVKSGAHNLDPGTYFIRVDTVNGSSAGIFDYRLAITVR